MILGCSSGARPSKGIARTVERSERPRARFSPGLRTNRLPPLKRYIATSICCAGKGRALQESRDVPKGGAEVKVYVPYPLRDLQRGVGTVDLRANDLSEAIIE